MSIFDRNTTKNKGAAIVEMTLLIPVLLGIIYLYIMLFLFLVQSGKSMAIMTDDLYCGVGSTMDYTQDINLSRSVQGSKKSVFIHESVGGFNIELQMHRKEDNTVENIRRWKVAADTFREGRAE